MKVSLRFRAGLFVVGIQAALLLNPRVSEAVTFTVTPAVVSNSYAGSITLQVGGLTNSETVLIEKYLDLNGNGLADAGEPMVQTFRLTDGLASVFAGVTNINVPYDADSTPGAITAPLSFQGSDIGQRLVGRYLYRLSSPTGRFAPITTAFSVTNSAYAQAVSGTVANLQTLALIPNAVVLLSPNGDPGSSTAGAVADASGRFLIAAPPGDYLLWGFKSNYTCGTSIKLGTGVRVALIPGLNATNGVALFAATNIISGKLVDAGDPSSGLPGVLLPIGWFGSTAVGFTDANGSFSIPFDSPVAGNAVMTFGGNSLFEEAVATHGYVDAPNPSGVRWNSGIDLTGLTITCPKATALFYGHVMDGQNHPLQGVELEASDTIAGNPVSIDCATDANGNYVLGVLAATWSLQLGSSQPSTFADYIFSMGLFSTNILNGTAVRYDFTGLLGTNQITGNVVDNLSISLGDIDVYAYAIIGGVQYAPADVLTDSDGNYAFSVPNGTWYVGLECYDPVNGSGLANYGYQCVGEQAATVLNNNPAVNFLVQFCSVQIVTVALPVGQAGSYYDAQLQASSCAGDPLTWFLIRGVMPPGLSLAPDGTISGFPSATGTFQLHVGVTDLNSFDHAEQSLTLVVVNPLQVRSLSLSNATAGQFYSSQLAASGGSPPYQWSLSPGSASLPSGMGLANNGTLSGTPAASGNFAFYVRASDSLSNSVDQLLSLGINGAVLGPPIVLANPQRLANGQFQFSFTSAGGTNYTVQYSSQLPNWQTLRAVVGIAGSTLVIDSNAPAGGARFYRVKLGQ